MNLKNFINDLEFKITILNNCINVVNYEELVLLSEDKIIIKNDNKSILIIGKNLSILKLLNQELLIKGIFQNIEFRWLSEKQSKNKSSR